MSRDLQRENKSSDGGLDYTELRELGYVSGLETHQQLDTASKLFCRCPCTIRNDEPDGELLRHMRPTLSEFGDYDGTALMEFKTRKQVHYLLYNDTVCTYEMDDTPPFKADHEALEISLRIAMMLNMSIVDEVHITRKQYLDGSIPTGFQRTAIIGVNGCIPFLGRDLHFIQMSLEEDACREVSDQGHHIFFRTDRLSMPLVEPVTAPELYTPWETATAARRIGEVLRSSRRVRRGIGSVRQDVNVSIKGGTRVEIKGVPKIGMIEDLCRVEGYRQKALLDMRYALRHSDLTAEMITPMRTALDGPQREAAESALGDVPAEAGLAALRMPGFARYLSWSTQPGQTFLDEIRGRVRVIACLETRPWVAEAPAELREMLGVPDEDGLLVFAGPEQDLETAASEIAIRAQEAFDGVPSETRQALEGGASTFERILPGPDRMYPDTDLPPEPIDLDMLERVRSELPPSPWKRRSTYRSLGVSGQLVYRLLNWERADMFDSILGRTDFRPSELAYTLTDRLRGSRRAGFDWLALGEKRIVETVSYCHEKGLTLKAAAAMLDLLAQKPEMTQEKALERVKPAVLRS